MAGFAAAIDRGRPVVNRGAIGDAAAGPARSPVPPPGAAAGQEPPQPLGLLRGAMDEGVDGLRAQGTQLALLAALQPAGDLLRRPGLEQPLMDEAAPALVAIEDRRPLPPAAVRALGIDRLMAALGQGIAPELAAEGRGDPTEPPGDLAICSLSAKLRWP